MLEGCELYLVTEDGQECALQLFCKTDNDVAEDLENLLKVVLIGSIFKEWITVADTAGLGEIPLSAVYVNKFDENGNTVPFIDFQSTSLYGRFDGHLTTYTNLTTGSAHQYLNIFDFYVDNNTNFKVKYKIKCANRYADAEDEYYTFYITKIADDLQFFNVNDKLIYAIHSFSAWRITLDKFLKGVKPYYA